MLEGLEHTIQSFFSQYGISTKSTISEMNDTDRVAKLLANQIFLGMISKEATTQSKVKTPKAAQSVGKESVTDARTAMKNKRTYTRKTKGAL